MYTPAEKILLAERGKINVCVCRLAGDGGVRYPDNTNKVYSKREAQSNANLPLKCTKLIGVEGHVHTQAWLIKCALRRCKYCQLVALNGAGPTIGTSALL